MKTPFNLIVVLGPTATGKTRFAVNLADAVDGEIISADSRQIYRKMNLGTGKDYDDYTIGGRRIPYHLVDIREPGYKYSVFEYQKDFLNAFDDITERNKIPILCGGTGLYIEAATRGYRLINVPVNESLREKLQDKTIEQLEDILRSYRKLHNKTDSDTKKRAIRAIEIEEYYAEHRNPEIEYPLIKPVYFGIRADREIRNQLIRKRLLARLENGLTDEVNNLIKEGISIDDLIYYGLEYKFVTFYLKGDIDHDTMVEKLTIAIRQFAKRQMTWFRKMEREGTEIHWIDFNLPMEGKLKKAIGLLNM